MVDWKTNAHMRLKFLIALIDGTVVTTMGIAGATRTRTGTRRVGFPVSACEQQTGGRVWEQRRMQFRRHRAQTPRQRQGECGPDPGIWTAIQTPLCLTVDQAPIIRCWFSFFASFMERKSSPERSSPDLSTVQGTPLPTVPHDDQLDMAAIVATPHAHNMPGPITGVNKRYRPAPAKTFQCRGYGDCRMVFSRSEHLARHIRYASCDMTCLTPLTAWCRQKTHRGTAVHVSLREAVLAPR